MNSLIFEEIEPKSRTQGWDGTAYFTYYDAQRLLNFIWDGASSMMEVEVGGDGEPVRYLVNAPTQKTTIIGFENYVREVIKAND